MSDDYYADLGVTRAATQDEIKAAYRKRAAENHPDRNKDERAAARMQEINDAYATLSDVEKRGRYDRMGVAGLGSLETEARNLVLQWTVNFMEQEQHPDLIAFVRQHCDGEERGARTAIANGEAALEKLRAKAARLRLMDPGKVQHDFLGSMLTQRTEQLRGMIEAAKRRVEALDVARNLISAYAYECAPVPNVVYFGSAQFLVNQMLNNRGP